ncbi:hypothetical protein Agub_g11468 [Astrephomene gubernaculifera]|uniref:Uncharacterized protein n=1 Tax=Astrephomene gubernaculifera TaxID=47775 RepID=A0AAD3HQH8_9CHLO|nr:hypothetical protein Agub_g11468 [Astrephomene gubernaculifera]
MEQPPGQLQRAASVNQGREGSRPCLLSVLQAVPCLWEHFQPADATRMSSVCKLARNQHFAGCYKLCLRGRDLSYISDVERGRKIEQHVQWLLAMINRGYRATQIEIVCGAHLKASLLITPISRAFGARLTSLSLHLADPHDNASKENSLGLPPTSSDWALRTAAALPALVSLSLHTASVKEEKTAMPLLHALAPQLRSLSWGCCWIRRLRGAVLQRMTGLQHLALDSSMSKTSGSGHHHGLGIAPACAAALAGLTWLRSLHLTSSSKSDFNTPKDAARELAALSALTGLTCLVLNTPVPEPTIGVSPPTEDLVGQFYLNSWRMSHIISTMQDRLVTLELGGLNLRAEDVLELVGFASLRRLVCKHIATPAFSVCLEQHGSSGGGGSGGGGGCSAGGFPLVPLPPSLRVLEVHSLPTLHLAASLALAPSRPRLVLGPDVPDKLTKESFYKKKFQVEISSSLALMGGIAAQHGHALPAVATEAAAATAAAAGEVGGISGCGDDGNVSGSVDCASVSTGVGAIGDGSNGGASGEADNDEGGSTTAASFVRPWLVEMVDLGARVIASAAEEYVARNRRPVPQALRDQAAADEAAAAAVAAAHASARRMPPAAAAAMSATMWKKEEWRAEAVRLAALVKVPYESYVRGATAKPLYDIEPSVRIIKLTVYEDYHRVEITSDDPAAVAAAAATDARDDSDSYSIMSSDFYDEFDPGFDHDPYMYGSKWYGGEFYNDPFDPYDDPFDPYDDPYDPYDDPFDPYDDPYDPYDDPYGDYDPYGEGYMSDGYGGDNPFGLPRARFGGMYGMGRLHHLPPPDPPPPREWQIENRIRRRMESGRVRGAHAGWLAALAPLRGLMGAVNMAVNMADVELGPGHMRVLLAACPEIKFTTGRPEDHHEMGRIKVERSTAAALGASREMPA